MTAAQARSDIDDRTTSALSTSSHTHVDYNDAHQHSPRAKMMAWSAKHADISDMNAESQQADHQHLPAPAQPIDTQQLPDTTQVGPRRTTASRPRTHRPPPPKCMQSCLESIESCTANVVRFNEHMEHNRAQAEAQRRETGDPPIARKAIIPLVFIILSWVFVAYVWRLCSRLIQQNPQGKVLGNRADGVGLLVGFVVLWLMTMWSYVTVISKGPGLVKDYIPETEPPTASHQAGTWDGAPYPPQQYPQNTTAPMAIPGQARFSSDIASMQASESLNGQTGPSPSNSLPYPSFNADLERFGGYRASSDSMRVLPGSVEPNHDANAGDFSHSRDMSRCTIVEEEAADTSAADLDARLAVDNPTPPTLTDNVEAADSQLPGVLGPLAADAVASREGAREGAEVLDQQQQQAPLPGANPPTSASGWALPQRRPANDPPPLSPAALYCHRCRRVKPPRAHHCRRCGTCVLKMDHHCPWVGGCVGAHNQRFFFIFVFWVTFLELYTLVTTATFFHRGVRSLQTQPVSAWKVDGFLISLFPICAVFLIFTGALLCTHVWLMGSNMTTIEHVGVSRVQGKERVLVDRWFGMQSKQQSGGAKGGLGGLNLKAKRGMIRDWDREWGRLSKEANRWWLGSSAEVRYPSKAEDIHVQTDASSIHAAHEKLQGSRPRKESGAKKGAWRTNMEQALGPSVLLWILPVGKHPNEGLEFPMNPRFGEEGVWRKREDWPAELR
ncbi:related to Zinc finger DHHC domain containing protein 2 [Ustilago trichophora]|uniref:Palmitoyltransferase n=1 Tax=Ustilago trichophora TaxID=86804 RepID=A0A5C3E094_9BASI|nr:related to Zinc finger DHHC domain containing protein 2 [Ustilago trichophora]